VLEHPLRNVTRYVGNDLLGLPRFRQIHDQRRLSCQRSVTPVFRTFAQDFFNVVTGCTADPALLPSSPVMHQTLMLQFADRSWITAQTISSEDARRTVVSMHQTFFNLAASRSRVGE
jgi:hypothetical protein